MASLTVRWSQHEAVKPYARPFMVSFIDDGGALLGSVAVSGNELLYVRNFERAVLSLAGELFTAVEPSARDPQRAWLDALTPLMPAADGFDVQPASRFDPEAGRVFGFEVSIDGRPSTRVGAETLIEYQEFQAAVAHGCGVLYRNAGVERIDDPEARHAAWHSVLRERVQRPDRTERFSETWPWR